MMGVEQMVFSCLGVPAVQRQACPSGVGGRAPAKGAADRRKKRKTQKLARRHNRSKT